jgi:hypothetical protein
MVEPGGMRHRATWGVGISVRAFHQPRGKHTCNPQEPRHPRQKPQPTERIQQEQRRLQTTRGRNSFAGRSKDPAFSIFSERELQPHEVNSHGAPGAGASCHLRGQEAEEFLSL